MNGRLLCFRILVASAGVLLGLVRQFAVAQEIQPAEWPNWRGPQQNRTSTGTNLIDSWDPEGGPGSNLIWKNTELGSRSTPIVMDGKLFTIVRDQPGTQAESEMVFVSTPPREGRSGGTR